jgi:hypothetical protein
MIENWIIKEIETQIVKRNRIVIIDPSGECGYLLPYIEKHNYVILKTDSANTEEWQRVQEELMLRYKAEKNYKSDNVIFYVTRTKDKLSFLFDYCFTHGCIDLTNPVEWLRKKLFNTTGHQIMLDNSMLLIAAKESIGKDISWWKKILQNLEEIISIEEALIPFLCSPDTFLNNKEKDVKILYEKNFFDLIGQVYREIPPKTLAKEIVNHLFERLLSNNISQNLLNIYHKWLDSNTYFPILQNYIAEYKISNNIDIWELHPDHCFINIDKEQLRKITANFREKEYVREKFQKLNKRIKGNKFQNIVPSWWEDIIVLFEFDNKPLSQCRSLNDVSSFYTNSFYKVDRAIRNIYELFLEEEAIVRPLQEYYDSLNQDLLHNWFNFYNEYKSNQQGYLPKLISQSKPGIAIIVGDGLRYEIAAYVASQLKNTCKISLDTMLADMPSETEHNMSALYVGNNQLLPIHKDREKSLSKITGKDITYLNLEDVNYGIKSDYLVLTYKDIDSAGEKLQMGAIKLFSEFEKLLIDKIQLLFNIGFNQVHLVTDHGFVLTGILDEADKIEPSMTGKIEVHERFVRTVDKQYDKKWLAFERSYKDFKYVYVAPNNRPFKSKGVYGFSHGGFTPQEIIIPNFVFSKELSIVKGLEINITNKNELTEVTGENFSLKIQAFSKADDLFSASRKYQVILSANNNNYSISNIFSIEPGGKESINLSFGGHKQITATLVDADTQEQLDIINIKQSNARDLGGLL